MKRSLIALSLVALATAAAAGVPSFSGESDFDRSLPTYPELGLSAQIQVAEGKYRFDAGESTHDLVVQDYGSA